MDHFRDLIHRVVDYSKSKDNVGYICSTERRSPGHCTSEIRLHLHFIAISHGFLLPERISKFWSDTMGNCEVEMYDSSLQGVGYILKMRDQDGCD